MWGGEGGKGLLTAFSACCWKCTKQIMLTAKQEVPRRVSLEARDIATRYCGLAGESMLSILYLTHHARLFVVVAKTLNPS
jgi:hypothetical protein